jgi:AcrR family transcriptional regulator
MPREVKPKRPYDSTRRREQAAMTRGEILAAADQLFEQHGYAGTTIAAIAAEAHVALKTVYLAFETKAGVLRALWNVRLRGADDSRPVAEREWYREVLEEPDPERQLRLNARNSRAGKQRIGAIVEVIRTAAPVDEQIAALWKRIGAEYRENQRAIVESLAEKGALAPEVDRASDILWAINHPTVWQLLVRERRWKPADYERWTGDLACSQLLREPGGR